MKFLSKLQLKLRYGWNYNYAQLSRLSASEFSGRASYGGNEVSRTRIKANGFSSASQINFKPRIDYKDVVSRTQYHEKNARRRNAANANPSLVAELYQNYGSEVHELDTLRQRRNTVAKITPPTKDSIAEGKDLKAKINAAEISVRGLLKQLESEAVHLPNDTHPLVPDGFNNVVVRMSEKNPFPSFPFEPRDHIQLGTDLGILDFETASKISGPKFSMLRGDGAMLEIGIVQWILHKLRNKGFTPILTPDLAHSTVVEGCGFQPRGEATQIYRVQNDGEHHNTADLCLIGTSEIPLAGFYAGKILKEADLPIRLAGFSHCFRAEAGGAGAASKGLYRLHQFSKVEMFVFCTQAQSDAELENMCCIQEEVCDDLGLHWRTLNMAAEELGATAFQKYDVEAWMPGRNGYGEVASISNCTDYQSRRLNIRYKGNGHMKDQGTEFVHTLNGTGGAIPRIILALLETHQNEDGTVNIPKILQDYLPGMGDKIDLGVDRHEYNEKYII